jgi:hypothetical protein
VSVDYAFQELDDLPAGFRERPAAQGRGHGPRSGAAPAGSLRLGQRRRLLWQARFRAVAEHPLRPAVVAKRILRGYLIGNSRARGPGHRIDEETAAWSSDTPEARSHRRYGRGRNVCSEERGSMNMLGSSPTRAARASSARSRPSGAPDEPSACSSSSGQIPQEKAMSVLRTASLVRRHPPRRQARGDSPHCQDGGTRRIPLAHLERRLTQGATHEPRIRFGRFPEGHVR